MRFRLSLSQSAGIGDVDRSVEFNCCCYLACLCGWCTVRFRLSLSQSAGIGDVDRSVEF